MKFLIKLVFCMILSIAIVLSISRFIVIRQNFTYNMKNTIDKNIMQNTVEKYYLERSIINDIENGKEITNENIIEYIKSLYSYMQTDQKRTALFTEKQELIYTDLEERFIENVKEDSMFNKDADTYDIKKIEDGHAIVFSSYWEINNKVIYIVNVYDISDIYEERNRQIRDMGISDLIILILASIFISIISIYITNPIRKLNEASKEIAKGNFSERVKIKTKDEIEELADSFNIMAEQIENKIETLNLSIKRKNDFINAFTHEIKTPLTAIIGYSDMLRLKKCDENISRKSIKLYLF